MRVLLTNDDGIEAPGIQALWESVHHAFADQSIEVIVVAPDRPRSECSHGVTSGPKRINEIRPGWFSVDGTPVDCVRVAINTVAVDPMIVFSGINAGANLGVNLMVSGTFAAAREAATHQIPAMAISHYRRPGIAKTWAHAPAWLKPTLQEFAEHEYIKRGSVNRESVNKDRSGCPLWNVNLPALDPGSDCPPMTRCNIDPCPIKRTAVRTDNVVEFELDFHNRPRIDGSDVDRCFSGDLTISELSPYFLHG